MFFLLHCYLGAGDEVLIGKGEDDSALLPHGSTDAAANQQLGAGFQELLASHQARASGKEK